MLLAAARRFLVLFAVSAGGTAGIGALFGVAAGASIGRAMAIGLYMVGSVVLVLGFFVGNRGPVRLRGDADVSFFRNRAVRWATRDEQHEAINLSAVMTVLGFTLVILGVAVDSKHSLF
jgi:hypothetical protein